MKKSDLFRLINSTFDDLFSNYHYQVQKNGDTKSESGIDENGQWSKSTFTSEDGTISYTSFVRLNDGAPITSKQGKLDQLKNELERLVETQEFEKAAEVRDRIKLLEKNSETINQLKEKVKSLVQNQEFEEAAKVRDQIKELEK